MQRWILLATLLLFATTAQAQLGRFNVDPASNEIAGSMARTIMHKETCGGEVPADAWQAIVDSVDKDKDPLLHMYVYNALLNLKDWQKRMGKQTFCARLAEKVREDNRGKPLLGR
jgi:hypothetical protein